MAKKLLGFMFDKDKESLQLFEIDGDLYVSYKKNMYPIKLSYARVPDGTFKQPVKSVPYIVLDGNVYHISEFISINDRL